MHKLVALPLAVAALALGACAKPPAPDYMAPPSVEAAAAARYAASQPAAPPAPTKRVAYAQMLQGRSGTYYVDVAIAGRCCFKMMLDTGASDVSVPLSLWYAMEKGGHIAREDYIGVANYHTANGVVKGLRFRMPPMTIAGVTVNNVIGSVSKNDTGTTILLGQSFLQKFKAWQIDNGTGQLILAY